jgi:hypothetical protein
MNCPICKSMIPDHSDSCPSCRVILSRIHSEPEAAPPRPGLSLPPADVMSVWPPRRMNATARALVACVIVILGISAALACKAPRPTASPEERAVRAYVPTHFNDPEVEYLEFKQPRRVDNARMKALTQKLSADLDGSTGFEAKSAAVAAAREGEVLILRYGRAMVAAEKLGHPEAVDFITMQVTIRARNSFGAKVLQNFTFYMLTSDDRQVVTCETDSDTDVEAVLVAASAAEAEKVIGARTVIIDDSDYTFHRLDCRLIVRNAGKKTIAEALQAGYKPNHDCKPASP